MILVLAIFAVEAAMILAVSASMILTESLTLSPNGVMVPVARLSTPAIFPSFLAVAGSIKPVVASLCSSKMSFKCVLSITSILFPKPASVTENSSARNLPSSVTLPPRSVKSTTAMDFLPELRMLSAIEAQRV